ncbi:hypothetical protein, partial [Serratia sp. CY39337]|uniref:hypothetical protein n=1 Tax=Serratia sp. CY39337 TaxID=3383614 RepID=UPI003FA1674E
MSLSLSSFQTLLMLLFISLNKFYQQATAASVATKQETNRENNHEKEEGGRRKWVKRCSSV